MSYFKAAGLMLLIHLAFAGLGWWLAGREGALFATVVALAFHLAVFWYAEKIVLKLHNAREVGSDDASPMIRAFVADCDRLAMRANMPRPRTYIIDAFQPNAFVAGRDTNHASIAVTDGLLKTLSRAEVSAVVAHELAHVKRGDALAMGICSALAAVLTTILGSIAYPFGLRKRVSRIVSGLVARIGQSHAREYAADKMAGDICGAPGEPRQRAAQARAPHHLAAQPAGRAFAGDGPRLRHRSAAGPAPHDLCFAPTDRTPHRPPASPGRRVGRHGVGATQLKNTRGARFERGARFALWRYCAFANSSRPAG